MNCAIVHDDGKTYPHTWTALFHDGHIALWCRTDCLMSMWTDKVAGMPATLHARHHLTHDFYEIEPGSIIRCSACLGSIGPLIWNEAAEALFCRLQFASWDEFKEIRGGK